MSLALALYRWLTGLVEPLAPRLLDARVRRGKEDDDRVDERLGLASAARPDGALVWLHGVSVGETLSLLPVVERVVKARPDLTVLVTSGTVTSAELLARRLPPGVIHQFAPVDGPCAVAAFLDHWRPDAALWVSWPKKISKVQTDIVEDTIREVALPLGFVDVKVCAVDGVWSGLKLVVRKELR